MITIPTLVEIRSRLKGYFEGIFGTTITSRSMLNSFVLVQANESKMQYLALGMIQKNILPDLADTEAKGGTLERFGRAFLNRNPTAPTQGVYVVQVTGTVGAVIPVNQQFLSAGSSLSPNYVFVNDTAVTLASTTQSVTVRALTGGLESLLNVGDVLSIVSPITNVGTTATVLSITTTPVDGESIDAYRRKIIDAMRLKPGSWSAIDYRLVGSNISGVSQIYAYAISGQPNRVNCFIEGNTIGVPPSAGVISDVETAIENVRPLIVQQVNYVACPLLPINISIVQVTTISSANRALIQTALEDAINGVRPFIGACDILADRKDTISTNYTTAYTLFLPTEIANAIPSIPFGAVTFTVDGTSETSYQFDNGEVPYLNTISYT